MRNFIFLFYCLFIISFLLIFYWSFIDDGCRSELQWCSRDREGIQRALEGCWSTTQPPGTNGTRPSTAHGSTIEVDPSLLCSPPFHLSLPSTKITDFFSFANRYCNTTDAPSVVWWQPLVDYQDSDGQDGDDEGRGHVDRRLCGLPIRPTISCWVLGCHAELFLRTR